ncbi:MAG: PAS domain S-box protein, partial [Proteobacteria bacterium]|nr:PAS domain S-box protein [Pseudomonadota bacterium]
DLAYGNWTLSVAPAKGWGDPLGLWLMAGLGLIFSLLLGYVAILVGRLRTYQGELQQKVTERTQALARVNDDLAGREALLRHILDMSSVAIFLVDMQGRITLANQRMAEMFGWPLAALAGKEYVSLVHPAERESGRQKMLALMGSTIGSVDLDRLYWRTDQTEFWGHLTGKRFYNSSGEESGLIGVIDDITERKQMEKALRESEEQLRAIMDNAGTVIFLKDPAGRYLHVNRQYEKLFHVTSAGIEGKTDHDIFPMDMANAFIKNDKYIVQSGLSQESEEHVPHDDGVHVYISAKFPLRNAAGEIYAVCGIATDITERKAAENALRESEESYRRQFVDNTVVMLLVDPADGRVIDANNAALEFYGYPRTQLMTMSMTEINLLPAAEVRRAMASVTAGHGKRFEFQHRLADGSVRDVEVSASQIRFGERLTLHSIIHDITLRKQAEAALIRSEGLLRLSQKAARMGYYVIDLASGQWESSPILDEIWGIDASFKRDTPGWVSLLHPDHRRRLLDDFNTTIRNRSAFSREYMVIRPNDGETRWVLAWGEFEYDSTGNPLRQVGAIQDITERRRTESELRVAATTFEAQEGMTITDAAKVILRVNRAFTEITGYSAEEAVGRTPRLLSSGRHDAAFYAAMWESIESTGSWQGEIWNRRKSGEVYPEWLTITVVKSDEGVVTHYVGTFAD